MAKYPIPPLDQKLPWEGSQAEFVTHVLVYTGMDILRNAAGLMEADDMGELFLKVYDVDIAPYPDFRTMRIAVGPAADPDLIKAKCAQEVAKLQAVQDAIDGPSVELSEQAELELIGAMVTVFDLRARLRRHVAHRPGFDTFPGFLERFHYSHSQN